MTLYLHNLHDLSDSNNWLIVKIIYFFSWGWRSLLSLQIGIFGFPFEILEISCFISVYVFVAKSPFLLYNPLCQAFSTANLMLFFYVNLVVLINLSDSLPILKSIMVKVKEALHSKDNMLPCLGKALDTHAQGTLIRFRRDIS